MKLHLCHLIVSVLLFMPATLVLSQDSTSTTTTTTPSSSFREIPNVPQDVTEVVLPPNFPKRIRVPRVMYTFEPSTSTSSSETTGAAVKVLTFPPNLFTAEQSGDRLELEWNREVAKGSREGGVIFQFPADQLRAVSVASDAHAQILEGFTNLDRLRLSGDAKLYATLSTTFNSDTSDTDGNSTTTTSSTSSTSSGLSLSLSSDSEAIIVSSTSIKDLSVTSDGKLRLQAPRVEHLSVSSDGEMEIHGDVDFARTTSDAELTIDGDLGEAEIRSDAEIVVYGSVTGSVDMSSDAKLYVGQALTGTVVARSDARVYAPTCDSVTTTSDAKCRIKDNVSGSVDVSVPIQAYTLTGTERCGWRWWRLFISLFLVVLLVAYYVQHRRRRQTAGKYPNSSNNVSGKVSEYHGKTAVAYATNDNLDKQERAEPMAEAVVYGVKTDDASQSVDSASGKGKSMA